MLSMMCTTLRLALMSDVITEAFLPSASEKVMLPFMSPTAKLTAPVNKAFDKFIPSVKLAAKYAAEGLMWKARMAASMALLLTLKTAVLLSPMPASALSKASFVGARIVQVVVAFRLLRMPAEQHVETHTATRSDK